MVLQASACSLQHGSLIPSSLLGEKRRMLKKSLPHPPSDITKATRARASCVKQGSSTVKCKQAQQETTEHSHSPWIERAVFIEENIWLPWTVENSSQLQTLAVLHRGLWWGAAAQSGGATAVVRSVSVLAGSCGQEHSAKPVKASEKDFWFLFP